MWAALTRANGPGPTAGSRVTIFTSLTVRPLIAPIFASRQAESQGAAPCALAASADRTNITPKIASVPLGIIVTGWRSVDVDRGYGALASGFIRISGSLTRLTSQRQRNTKISSYFGGGRRAVGVGPANPRRVSDAGPVSSFRDEYSCRFSVCAARPATSRTSLVRCCFVRRHWIRTLCDSHSYPRQRPGVRGAHHRAGP